MDKKPLIVVSICAVVLLIIASLSNVVGYQTVQVMNQVGTNNEVNKIELLFQTILDLINSNEIQQKSPSDPILLVHGWQFTGPFSPNDLWNNMAYKLTEDNESSLVGGMERYAGNGFIVYVSHYAHDITEGMHKDIREYANNLAEEIDLMKSTENVSKVVIVAHSMGGLVSRAYIESSDFGNNSYRDDVSKLILLGVPNHGVNWRLIFTVFPILPLIYLYFIAMGWIAEWQMRPYSSFLNILNHGKPLKLSGEDIINSDVDYSTIAGNIRKSIIWGDIDGFISVRSVQLSNVQHFNFPVNHDELRTNNSVYLKVKELILQN